MARIEVMIQLQLPHDSISKEACKAAVMEQIKADSDLQNIMLKNAENQSEAELSLSFEQSSNLDAVLSSVENAGAEILAQFILLPSSLSGIADVYDARDNGALICEQLKRIDGVVEAGAGSNGGIRMQCATLQLDSLLEQAKSILSQFKSQKFKNSN